VFHIGAIAAAVALAALLAGGGVSALLTIRTFQARAALAEQEALAAAKAEERARTAAEEQPLAALPSEAAERPIGQQRPDPEPVPQAPPLVGPPAPPPERQTATEKPGPAPAFVGPIDPAREFVGPPAPPAEVAVKPPPPEPPKPFKRRKQLSDEDLRKQLLPVPELALDTVPQASTRVVNDARSLVRAGKPPHVVPTLLDKRSDLAGLPMRMGADCQLGKEPTENLQVLSVKVRQYVAASLPRDRTDPRPDPVVLRDMFLDGPDSLRREWLQTEAIPTLQQMLQTENKPCRLLMVELFGRMPHQPAAVALAQRALFDLSPEVREAAVAQLKGRPREHYRPALLAGLRHPWPPVADHAAEALVALGDTEALPKLVSLLDEPDPRAAFKLPDRQTPYVHEMVRVNHLRNCLLCHPPSFALTDPVRGLVPAPNRPISSIPTAVGYGGSQGTFIRADITYLKQDFSVPQPVAKPGLWPLNQRYDYLVRTRPATVLEANAPLKANYEQREAVLFALRELTGKDEGVQSEGWRKLLAEMKKPPT
jgi:hypothetical protein